METRNGDDPEENDVPDEDDELCDLVRDNTPVDDYIDRNITMIGIAMQQLNLAHARSLDCDLPPYREYKEGLLCLKLMKLISFLEEG